MRIGLNVARSRLTILGFTLTLYLFSTGVFVSMGGRFRTPVIWTFLTSFVPLTIGFALALFAVLLLLKTQRMSLSGDVEIWSFSCAELLTYLAVAQALSGGMHIFFSSSRLLHAALPELLDAPPQVVSELVGLSSSLSIWLALLGGLAWAAIVYLAPAVFLIRVPLARRGKVLLGAGYLLVLISTFWITAHAYQIKSRAAGEPTTLGGMFAAQFWQPAVWDRGVPELRKLWREQLGDPAENRADGGGG